MTEASILHNPLGLWASSKKGVNALAGCFRDPSVLVRQPHDLECKNFKRRRGKKEAGEAANDPAQGWLPNAHT